MVPGSRALPLRATCYHPCHHYCPAVFGSWKQVGLLQRCNSELPSHLVLWYHFIPEFPPGLPSDAGHSSLRWSTSSITKLISPPLPCFTLCVLCCVTAASLCPCVLGLFGEIMKQEGQATCPEAAQGCETNSRHRREGEASLEGPLELWKHCGLQSTFTLSLLGGGWLEALGNEPSPPQGPRLRHWLPLAFSEANSLSGFKISFRTTSWQINMWLHIQRSNILASSFYVVKLLTFH